MKNTGSSTTQLTSGNFEYSSDFKVRGLPHVGYIQNRNVSPSIRTWSIKSENQEGVRLRVSLWPHPLRVGSLQLWLELVPNMGAVSPQAISIWGRNIWGQAVLKCAVVPFLYLIVSNLKMISYTQVGDPLFCYEMKLVQRANQSCHSMIFFIFKESLLLARCPFQSFR